MGNRVNIKQLFLQIKTSAYIIEQKYKSVTKLKSYQQTFFLLKDFDIIYLDLVILLLTYLWFE